LATARAQKPDLVVLDLGLPELDGLDVARTLRRESNVPIVMLTGRSEESDKLVGLEIGADDYVTKPFSPKELVARVRAVLRRTERPRADTEIVRVGDLTLDMPRMRATVGDRVVELTPTEFQLVATMAGEPGRVFTRAQLLDAVHGVAFESYERAIDAHVKNIRHKLESEPARPRYLLTVYGVGYRFAELDEWAANGGTPSVGGRRGGRRTNRSRRDVAGPGRPGGGEASCGAWRCSSSRPRSSRWSGRRSSSGRSPRRSDRPTRWGMSRAAWCCSWCCPASCWPRAAVVGRPPRSAS